MNDEWQKLSNEKKESKQALRLQSEYAFRATQTSLEVMHATICARIFSKSDDEWVHLNICL